MEFNGNRQRQRRQFGDQVQKELDWCRKATSKATQLHKGRVTHFLTTDAADSGRGAQLNSVHMSGTWTISQRSWHSNKKELLAVYLAIKQQSHQLRKTLILLQTGNRTVVAYIQKEGGTRSLGLYELTYDLLHLVDQLEILLSAHYLPGKYNGIVDRLSRGGILPEWHLRPEATQEVFRKWGVPEIDLFASAESAVVKAYVSRDCKDQSARFIDAFSRVWDYSLAWAFPPPNLLPRVLAHLNRCRGRYLIVTPKWEQTFWMADLASRSLEQANDNQEPGTGTNGSVNRMTKDWSSQERDLVRESWRASTLLTYKTPIKKWLAWCREKGMDPVAPRGVDLARFLSHLFLDEKLVYSTILVHKSAIATFCAKRDLSSDFLVKQVLKAISVARPKETRSSIWDAQILLDWLKLDLPNLSFFEVSRRAATILLLASGRRVHDLTLLKISKESLDNLGNEIILWPSFGSKTNRAEFRQSGWRLSKHENIRICLVTWVRALIKLSEKRRSSQNLEELFITVTGSVKPASRTIIAGWVRSVLKEADIDASPGSVRAAVASRGWLDNLPVQEILERGNWRSVETFRNHYCKQIEGQGQESQGLLFNNFNPIGRTGS
ncbi:uncharacterized protein LOC123260149 [Cotesia glomerata]|uniref:uncharacterized protein LOC123260149 n=1 Tax=Cotesia glomerata TaxID=32391 RepID=UPI001D034377|nr:uncharacterized protein LOC123260149 [Cotesia glomerata]XP_044577065.1 uncharacterized protein LOC123260149 [Cotesia glomerata]